MDIRAICRLVPVLAAVVALTPRPVCAQTAPLPDFLRTVGDYVTSYLTRVQSIVVTEKVVVQPIARDWSADGRPRTLSFELRLDWTPGADVAVRRDLLRVNGRLAGPRDEAECMDSAAITPEPLEFLLPERQDDTIFEDSGAARLDGKPMRVISYRSRTVKPPVTTWKDGCGSIDPGQEAGKVWADADSGEVRRVDSGFTGMIDVRVPRDQPWNERARNLTFERHQTSIRYRPVRFDDPEETLLLPSSVDSLTIIRNATSLRIRHEYSGYRRFVTGGRIVRE